MKFIDDNYDIPIVVILFAFAAGSARFLMMAVSEGFVC
jgi:hypothetical protein